jgi:hypothetical protein
MRCLLFVWEEVAAAEGRRRADSTSNRGLATLIVDVDPL